MACIKIYVVVGSTSDGEVTVEWNVMAYVSQAKAMAMSERLNTWCKERRLHGAVPAGVQWYNENGEPKDKPPEDPGFKYYPEGTHYYVDEIDVDMDQ